MNSRCEVPFVSSGSSASSRPMSLGMDGPNTSKSKRPTRKGRLPKELMANERARFAEGRKTRFRRNKARSRKRCTLAMVLFPTPPFPLATAITFLTFGTGLLVIGPPLLGICGGNRSPERGKPLGHKFGMKYNFRFRLSYQRVLMSYSSRRRQQADRGAYFPQNNFASRERSQR